jgi:hypothetical protein
MFALIFVLLALVAGVGVIALRVAFKGIGLVVSIVMFIVLLGVLGGLWAALGNHAQ